MLDPVVTGAFVVVVGWLLKLLVTKIGLPLDDATLNALAVAIVSVLLGLFGLEVVKRLAPKLKEKGLLK
jgi:hypothetical protein